jgi:hypothetical protein
MQNSGQNSGKSAGEVLGLIAVLIGEGWGLIYRLAIVVIAIAFIVFLIKGCAANATLNEHSSCSQYEQADTDTQNKVLQQMLDAHNDHSDIQFARTNVELYCTIKGDNAPIDGVYSGGHIDQQPSRALHGSAPSIALIAARP